MLRSRASGDRERLPGHEDRGPGGQEQPPGHEERAPGRRDRAPDGQEPSPGHRDRAPDHEDQPPADQERPPLEEDRESEACQRRARPHIHELLTIRTPPLYDGDTLPHGLETCVLSTGTCALPGGIRVLTTGTRVLTMRRKLLATARRIEASIDAFPVTATVSQSMRMRVLVPMIAVIVLGACTTAASTSATGTSTGNSHRGVARAMAAAARAAARAPAPSRPRAPARAPRRAGAARSTGASSMTTGGPRPWPDTSSSIQVFSDQFDVSSASDAQLQFAATHYAGAQKLLASEVAKLRAYPRLSPAALPARSGPRRLDPQRPVPTHDRLHPDHRRQQLDSGVARRQRGSGELVLPRRHEPRLQLHLRLVSRAARRSHLARLLAAAGGPGDSGL